MRRLTRAGTVLKESSKEVLYHYSVKQHKKLLTSRQLGKTDPAKIATWEKIAKKFNLVGAYCDHISFFFDPAPMDILGAIFGPGHAAWFPGSKLYEHVVTVSELVTEGEIPYEVVETLTDRKIMDSLDWTNHEKAIKEFFRLQRKEKILTGEIAWAPDKLLQQMAYYRGGTREAYLKAATMEDFEENRMKYAANVPHLMAYPVSGVVVVESSRLVVVK